MRLVLAFRFQPGLVLALLAFSAMAPRLPAQVLDPAEVQSICAPRPFRIELANIDADSNVDLAVVGLGPQTDGLDIAVAFGNGAGGFSDCGLFSYTDSEPPFLPADIDIAHDFNEDGAFDVLVSDMFPEPRLLLFLSNPSAPSLDFSEIAVVEGHPSLYGASGVADLDGDGHIDLVTSQNHFLDFWRGNGTGHLESVGRFEGLENERVGLSWPSVEVLRVADLDADGNVDLVVDLEFPRRIIVLTLSAAGDFTDWTVVWRSPDLEEYQTLHDVADVTGNGQLDLLWRDHGRERRLVGAFEGQGDGTFAAESILHATAVRPHSVTVGDFDQDGRNDLLVKQNNTSPAYFQTLLSSEDYESHADRLYESRTLAQHTAIDLDGDGTLDLAAPSPEPSGIEVIRGLPRGRFATTIASAWACGVRQGGALGDFDEDGTADILTFRTFEPGPEAPFGPCVLRGQDHPDTPSLEHAASYPDTAGRTNKHHPPAVADFDRDGHLDVFYPLERGDPPARYALRRGAGDGTLRDAEVLGLPVDIPVSWTTPLILGHADLNDDGNPDVIVRDTYFRVLLGDGAGGFQETWQTIGGHDPVIAAIADLAGDDHVDVLLYNVDVRDGPTQPEILILVGHGDGTFDETSVLRAADIGSFGFSVAAADFDRDGALDIVLNRFLSRALQFFRGRRGGFDPGSTVEVGREAVSLRAADVNADGNHDVILYDINEGPDDVSVLYGRGDGTFSPPRTVWPESATDVFVTDLSGDGRPDFVLLGQESGVEVLVQEAPSPGSRFLRADCNDDGNVDISDAVSTLGSLFLGAGDPECDDACDSNDDSTVDISDAINTLGVLFLGNGIIPLPGMTDCGVDPTDDDMGCETVERCP